MSGLPKVTLPKGNDMRNEDLIRAALEGKTIQWRHKEDSGLNVGEGWRDMPSPDGAIVALITDNLREFRLKPETYVRWFPVVKTDEGKLVLGDSWPKRDDLPKELYAGAVVRHLRLELAAEGINVISATVEAP
jgi:hypothetical protein